MPTPSGAGASPSATHRLTVIAVVAGAAIVLIFTAPNQVFDANFYALTPAVSLLAGDRIYRDFFESGIPLAAYMAAGAQWISGHRLIGEFVRQWLFILAGFGIATHLGVRLSRSMASTLAMMAIALCVLTVTPIYHHDKLFFFPLITWACWRYIDQPSPIRGAVCGGITALAFLYRHDYGVYLGATSVWAFLLARFAVVESRRATSLIRDAAAYAVTVGALLAPWIAAVQMSEGLANYTRSRAELVQLFQGSPGLAYRSLLLMNPIRTFTPPPLRENIVLWIQQMSLLVPVVLLLAGGRVGWRSWRPSGAVPAEACRMMLAGGLLVVVDMALLREPSYVVVVVPLVAALSARFLVSPSRVMRAGAMTVAALTILAALLWAKSGPLYASPADLISSVRETFHRLVMLPPEYGYVPFQYLRECTAPGDHVLVMGGTPLHVSYYAQRPIAGGHINWRRGWRSDPIHEAESLALLQRQSVPFALSTAGSVLDNLKNYPRIHAYIATHYASVEGTSGYVMVDTRRPPTGQFSPMKAPCFR